MNFRMILLLMILILSSCSTSNKNKSPEIVKAYIKSIGLDSISKADFFQEKYIQFTQKNIKITQAVAYFYGGESFTNVQQQAFAGNNISFLNLYTIINAKTPFHVTIADIGYVNKKGNKGRAEEFSFVVY